MSLLLFEALGIGAVLGLLLGLTGAGGSLVALPLLLSLHLPLRDAIGVSLGAVALTALIGAVPRARLGQVAWRPVLLLAVSGLYSVIAFFVALRTNEFGIRVALGARSADIVRMVLGQALRLAAVGLVVGFVLGVPLLIALHANFPFTDRFDPAVILPPALALALTALVAGWVPARRASSIQASEALRAD